MSLPEPWNESRDLDLAASFFRIVHAPELWPSVTDEAETWRSQASGAVTDLHAEINASGARIAAKAGVPAATAWFSSRDAREAFLELLARAGLVVTSMYDEPGWYTVDYLMVPQ